MVTMVCGECGIEFSVPDTWERARRKDHDTFYCPNGCARWFPDKSDLEKAEARVKELESSNKYLADINVTIMRSRAAIKGQLTKERNRRIE